jgi:hypothetical protein
LGLVKVQDVSQTEAWVRQALQENPEAVQTVLTNPKKAKASEGFLRGQVMKLSGGKADGKLVGELIQKLIQDLRSRQLKSLPPYRVPPTNFAAQRVEGIRAYFLEISRKNPRRYSHFVNIYAQAHEAELRKPVCERGWGPLDPMQIDGLPKSPHTMPPQKGQGGRPKDPNIQARNDRIRELRAEDFSAPVTVRKLDSDNIPVPKTWENRGWHTWRVAYQRDRKLVSKFLSNVGRRSS